MRVVYLVPANERELGLERPVALAGVEIGVADTGALEADEALAGLEVLGLADGVVVNDVEGGCRALDDGRLLGLGDLELGGGHGRRRAGAGGGGRCGTKARQVLVMEKERRRGSIYSVWPDSVGSGGVQRGGARSQWATDGDGAGWGCIGRAWNGTARWERAFRGEARAQDPPRSGTEHRARA